MNKWLRIIALVAIAAVATGCFKKVTLDCRYNLRPYLQMESGGEAVVAEGVVAYAFAADTTQWTVASYEDALAGVLTSKTSTEKRSDAMVHAVQEGAEDLVLQLTATPATIVVVDTVNKLYGWRMTEVAENLPDLYVSITFRPWSVKKVYAEGAWRMNNEAYVAPEPEPEPPTDGEQNEGQYSPAEPIE